MRRLRVAAAALVGLTMLAACAGGRPAPESFRSPLTVRTEEHRLFFALTSRPAVKLGVGADRKTAGCEQDLRALGAGWCYDWSPVPACQPGVEAVPMVYTAAEAYEPVGGCSEWILGFNEPDLTTQANVSPAAAVKPWAALESRNAGRKLVAPAPSRRGPDWLPRFREEFMVVYGRYPRFDALAVHCYFGTASLCIAETERVIGLAREWGRDGGALEVWVTEFWFAREAEARAYVAWLEREARVTRYSPFAARFDCADTHNWNCATVGDPSLLDGGGRLTEWGVWVARPTPEGP